VQNLIAVAGLHVDESWALRSGSNRIRLNKSSAIPVCSAPFWQKEASYKSMKSHKTKKTVSCIAILKQCETMKDNII